MPDSLSVQRRLLLSRLPNSKLTVSDQEELAALQMAHGQEAEEAFRGMVAREMAKVGLDLAAEFGYAKREEIAGRLADVPLPEPDQIVPETYARALYSVESAIIQVSGLVRQARARYDLLSGTRDSLETTWRNLSVETVEWKADAAASHLLADLRRETTLAKAHASFCDNCYEVVRSKIFTLNWMMQNYDRHHGVGTTPRTGGPGGTDNSVCDPHTTQRL